MIFTVAVMVAMVTTSSAQMLISNSSPQITNFNGWNGTFPNGWTATGSGSTYVSASASTTGGIYALSGQGIDYQPSSNAYPVNITGTYQNNTGATITNLHISYVAFNAVLRTSRLPGWTVTSSLGTVSSLNWTYNAAASSTAPDSLYVDLTGLSIANGDNFTLTFTSDRGTGSGSSPMIGMNYVTVTNLTNPTSLPIHLLSFTASPDAHGIILNWQTAMESNADHFQVESSTDAKSWNTIGNVKAKGSNSSYSLTDIAPANGINYYRLSSVDIDGTSQYSPVVSQIYGRPLSFRVAPNPVCNGAMTTVLFSKVAAANTSISITNVSGHTVAHLPVPEGTTAYTLSTAGLTPGYYFISVINDGNKEINKILVQ